jgi:hypothetical protein
VEGGLILPLSFKAPAGFTIVVMDIVQVNFYLREAKVADVGNCDGQLNGSPSLKYSSMPARPLSR